MSADLILTGAAVSLAVAAIAFRAVRAFGPASGAGCGKTGCSDCVDGSGAPVDGQTRSTSDPSGFVCR